MSFDSFAFLVFLPTVTLLHWLLPHRMRWVALLIASYVCYAWKDASLALLILSVTGMSYLAALMLTKVKSTAMRKFWLIANLLFSLGLLAYFKYFNLLGRAATALAHLFTGCGPWETLDILLPVGISFFTFQSLSYVVDVYRNPLAVEKHFGYYALFISFFPQLVAGPIERADRLLPQFHQVRHFQKDDLYAGFFLLVSGFFRKFVIADLCAPLVNTVYSAPNPDGSMVFLGTILFAVQIYCDFAGYSEIASGAARLMGIRLIRNFRSPYAATCMRDFWRRWHISLSAWFTDYVYIPLGGSRKGLFRQIVATFVVFALSGLWHGAQWSFLVWGFLHGCAMTVEIVGRRTLKTLRSHDQTHFMLPANVSIWLGRIATVAFVCFTWIFFRAGNLSRAFSLIHTLFSPWDVSAVASAFTAVSVQSGGVTGYVVLLACMLLTLPLLPRLTNESAGQKSIRDITWVYSVLAIALAWVIRLHSGVTNAFIYFQF